MNEKDCNSCIVDRMKQRPGLIAEYDEITRVMERLANGMVIARRDTKRKHSLRRKFHKCWISKLLRKFRVKILKVDDEQNC